MSLESTGRVTRKVVELFGRSVLVTGANGFVGRRLCNLLDASGARVRRVARTSADEEVTAIGDIGTFDEWASLLVGIDVIVHLAARAHVPPKDGLAALREYRRVNLTPSERITRAAAAAGVRRVILLSSIGVCGNATHGEAFSERSPAAPQEAYAVSKLEAEQVVRLVGEAAGIESVIVRSPLVYGPGAKGNFLRLMKLVRYRVPLPFAAISNKRSFVGLDNLCDYLCLCVADERAAGETLMVSDAEQLSTPELLRLMAESFGQSLWMPRVPPEALRRLGRITGYGKEIDRLCDSLEIDSSYSRALLDWHPSHVAADGIREMVLAFRSGSGA